ncbi:hypothetical protein [Acetobacter nitrogenifigens]|uniref:Uncharacterized protein n=1 Tax=Acetobacter nitrogenifigens DSM 23921 = NBRC 105050 TaxID=1120919 RepID=A0A511X6F9_9PROT|nr:hypothetical protein [Acetobacter nitrogenifigens]GEN58536.1 hypothetical protein ANI02nite_04200 [Acetobacter nitrogenifigens DSM 23921 = NBRC 105050]
MRDNWRAALAQRITMRVIIIVIGLVTMGLAARFAIAAPDVMPGEAMGMVVLVVVGALLLLGAIWVGL